MFGPLFLIFIAGAPNKTSHTQLAGRTDETQVGGESPTHYHLLKGPSQASADFTAHSYFILGLKSYSKIYKKK